MSLPELIKLVDGGVAVAVMLIVGYRVELSNRRREELFFRMIDKLTNGHKDND